MFSRRWTAGFQPASCSNSAKAVQAESPACRLEAGSPRGFMLLAAALLLSACATAPDPAPRWSIVVHGGAGVIERASLTPELEAQYRAAMQRALDTGGGILERGGSSLDAVEAVIREMEDDPLFNAGRGAVFTAEGRNELDASIMDGRTRAAGSVAGITRTKHPILAARAVMERSPHVMLVGEGAERFARSQNLEEVEPSYFFTERRWQQLEANLRANNLPIPQRPAGAPPAPRAIMMRRRTITSSAPSASSPSIRAATSPPAPRRAAPPANAGAASATRRSSARARMRRMAFAV